MDIASKMNVTQDHQQQHYFSYITIYLAYVTIYDLGHMAYTNPHYTNPRGSLLEQIEEEDPMRNQLTQV